MHSYHRLNNLISLGNANWNKNWGCLIGIYGETTEDWNEKSICGACRGDLRCFSLYCFGSCHAKTCFERRNILQQWSNYTVPALLASFWNRLSALPVRTGVTWWYFYYLYCQKLDNISGLASKIFPFLLDVGLIKFFFRLFLGIYNS